MKTFPQKFTYSYFLKSFLFFLTLFLTINQQSFAASKDKKLASSNKYSAMLSIAEDKGALPVIIKFKNPSSATDKQSLSSTSQIIQERINLQTGLVNKLAKYKPENIKHFEHIPYSAMHLSAKGLKAAMLDPGVVEIYEDTLNAPTLATSSPLIGATAAANSGYGGQGQVVAILDTGVESSHSFLAGKVVYEACFSQIPSGQSSTTLCPNGQGTQYGSGAAAPCEAATSGCSHGTHVAGIAAGKGSSFSGVAKEANIMAIQVFSKFTGSDTCGSSASCVRAYTSNIIAGLEHVYSQRNTYAIASANMSLGGGEFTSACDSDPRKSIIDLLRAAGIATVISSGNSGFTNSMGAPGCISSAVSVGSTTKQDEISSFSNSANFLDLLAPGSSINSSVPGGSFSSFSGTSMAAPQVAGAFAVLKSRLPSASVDQIENVLKSTGVSLLDTRNNLTKPRIQIDSALTVINPPAIPTLSISPADNITISGPAGGPFTPSNKEFTLTNTTSSSQALNYSVSENANWLQIDSTTTGQITANNSISVSTSVISSAANSLPIGQYPATLSFNNTTNSAGSTQVTITLVVTGDNDYFSNAILIAQSGEETGTTIGNNETATIETGEPDHAKSDKFHSVWWRWTAPANGDMILDTCGSDFDTLLGVYTGTVINALSETASNDDFCGRQSQVSFSARAGVTYFIATDGYSGNTGNIVLNWGFSASSNPPPSISILPTSGVTITGNSTGPFAPNTTTYSITNVGASNQEVTIDTPPWLYASISSFSLTPGNTISVTFSVNSLAAAMPPGIYSGVVDFGHFARAIVLNLTSGALSNDHFQSAAAISGQTKIEWNSNLATKEIGEPNHAGNSGGKSVWWKWTAPKSGIVTIDTEGSTFDTILGVYIGSNLSQLTSVISNDDAGTGLTSKVTLTVHPNIDYFIAVDGYNARSGSLHLNIAGDIDLTNTTKNDFNGDGKSDILWRHNSAGLNYMYLMDGTALSSHGVINTVADLNWQIKGTGDFDGDGKMDILWRNSTTGQNYLYMMNGNLLKNHGAINTLADLNWKIKGVDDFNGDGYADILWRNITNGQNFLFMMDANTVIDAGSVNTLADLNWEIKGTGDFNADGYADILWRNVTNGQNYIFFMNANTVIDAGPVNTLADLNWEIKGVDDFNGDDRPDILWRNNSTGQNYIFFMNANTVIDAGPVNTLADLNWEIKDTGDYNGDGTPDILWRNNSNGGNYIFFMNANTVIDAGSINTVPDLNWEIKGGGEL